MREETIAAVATGLVEAGVAVIRVSGEGALRVGARCFRPRRGVPLGQRRSHTVVYGDVLDMSGHPIDEGLALVMRGPNSYTGEDVVELHCHGGLVSVRQTLDAVLGAGARLAEPGEFTRRAFLNGRMDLSQAESVIDLIRAKTDMALSAAVRQLKGELAREVHSLRRMLLESIAHLEADIDFPELELETQSLAQTALTCREALERVNELLTNARRSQVLRNGLRLVLAGRPNVGKSSLMNALAGEDRSIVTPVAGTTRDVVEHWVNLGGIPVVLADTAGIRQTEDLVERAGVERSQEMLRRADLVLWVIDASAGFTRDDERVRQQITGTAPVICIANKCDLVSETELQRLQAATPETETLPVSAVSREGLMELERRIVQIGGAVDGTEGLLVNARQEEVLRRAVEHLEAALETMRAGYGSDLVSIDIRSCWNLLGEITGETVGEDLLDQIFSQFCIGK